MNVRYILTTNTVSCKIHQIFPVADLFFLLTTCDTTLRSWQNLI